jgi:DNA polymerase delta subunit 1
MYGVSESGHSVLAHVHGFSPYFWCNLPSGFQKDRDEAAFRDALEARLKESARGEKCTNYVLQVVTATRTCIMGYKEPSLFAKVTVAMPQNISAARGILERGFRFGRFEGKAYQTYVEERA